jgi:hypothetical protein
MICAACTSRHRTVIVEIVLWDDDDKKQEALLVKIERDSRVLSVKELSQ